MFSTLLGNLTPEQRELLTGIENYSGEVVVPAGDVGTMLEFASAQRGKPYRWGAVGPDSYDCSGLVQTAFRAAGVSVPRVSRQQATVGMQVSRGDVRPGDLVFGDVVKISAIDRIGQISVIRRVIG